MVSWKHRQAERDVAPLLRAAAAIDSVAVTIFPRPLIEILAASLPALDVHRTEGLDLLGVVRLLEEDHFVDAHHLLAGGNPKLGGFTYANRERVLIFVETRFGPEFEAFTIAHEAGHIITDVLPRLASGTRSPASANAQCETLIAQPDTVDMLLDGSGAAELMTPFERPRATQRHTEARMREVIANAIAAELLAPWREVERIADEADGSPGAIDVVRDCFGLSRTAARIRLTELRVLNNDDVNVP